MKASGSTTGTMRSRIVVDPRDRKINAVFFRRVALLVWPYWLRRWAWTPWALLAAAFTCNALNAVASGYNTQLVGEQTNALVAKSVDTYWPLTLTIAALFVGKGVVSWVSDFVTSYLEVHWRRFLTTLLVDRYLANRAYYDINIDRDIDNPDQRIQEEIAPLCKALVAFPPMIFSIGFSITIQMALLSRISPLIAPAIFVLSGIRILAFFYVYRPGIGIAWDVKIAEADLRYGVLHVRDNAETIAFYGGEEAECQQIDTRLRHAVRHSVRNIVNDVRVQFFIRLFELAEFALPLIFVIPLYLSGKIEFGAIASAAMATMVIQSAIGNFERLIPTLSHVAPNAVRLAQVLEKSREIEERHRTRAEKPGQHSIALFRGGDAIRVDHVTYQTPGGERSLVRDISFDLEPGQRMIVVGQTGVGKSSFLRVLAGLWTRGSGRLDLPPLERMLFMPQKPYMMLGTLRSQLIYPKQDAGDVEDEVLLAALRRVNLGDLVAYHGGLDAEQDWSRILSLGEQQRIGFARFLISKPAHVFLDEATSAVDVATEALLYGLLVEAGATVVSVAHRTSIIPFHHLMLELREGGWSLRPATMPSPPVAEGVMADQSNAALPEIDR